MSDNTEYWQEFVAKSGDLVFVRPEDSGSGVVFLSRTDTPVIDNDRDRALLKAYLELALERLTRQQYSLMPLASLGPLDAASGMEDR